MSKLAPLFKSWMAQPAKAAVLGFSTCALMVLTSCTADNLANPNLEGTASFTVLDANTGLPVDGVTIDFVGGSEKKTSSIGQATFDDVRAGAYQVRLSKAGYQTSQEALTVSTSGSEDIVAINVAQTYRIHRIGGSVTGRILLHPLNWPDTSANVATANIQVELRITASGAGSSNTTYLNPIRTTTTSATGTYTFDSLPEVSNYSITVPVFTNGGKTYNLGATSVASALLFGQQYTQPISILAPSTVAGTVEVFARSTSLAANQTWDLEFSSSIDTTKLTTSAIQLLRSGTATNSVRTWSSNFTVLSIRPATGTWTGPSTYSVVLTGLRDTQSRIMATTTLTATPTP